MTAQVISTREAGEIYYARLKISQSPSLLRNDKIKKYLKRMEVYVGKLRFFFILCQL